MPNGSPSDGSNGDDFASTDEVKVYKEEGEPPEENKSLAENLSEEKLGLLTETEQGKGLGHSSVGGRFNVSDPKVCSRNCLADYYSFRSRIPFGYHTFINPYSYTAGSSINGFNNVPILPPSPWFYMYSNDSAQSQFGLPPSPLHFGPPTGYGQSSAIYRLPGTSPSHQLSHLFCANKFSPVSCFDQFSQGNHIPYPMGFSSQYLSQGLATSPLSHFHPGEYFSTEPHHPLPPPPPNIPCPGISHPTLVSTYAATDEPHVNQSSAETNRHQRVWFPLGAASEPPKSMSVTEKPPSVAPSSSSEKVTSKQTHIKKPLNAFMLFMKEMRSKIVDEYTLKESAAINQILGRKWHSLDQAEQNKYYEMARKEKLRHRQMFPSWSARDNYATQIKKKRKREQMNQLNRHLQTNEDERDTSNSKKCRARYGLDQQHRWCKPCRRKKRCIRFLDNEDAVTEDSNQVPAADSTVNETNLYMSIKSALTSSGLETDCVINEPLSSRSLSSSDPVTFEEFPRVFQPYQKPVVSPWNQSSCSSAGFPSRSNILPGAMQTHDSNKRISSTTLLSVL